MSQEGAAKKEEVSRDDLKWVAKVGKITGEDLKKLELFLRNCVRHNNVFAEAKTDHRTHMQQLALMREVKNALEPLVEDRKVLRALVTATELRRVSKRFTVEHFERALGRIPRQVRRQIGALVRLRRQADMLLEELEQAPVLPVVANAAKPGSDHLALQILLFWKSINRLGVDVSDPDLVAFAGAVFEVIERDDVKLSAARQRRALSLKAIRQRLERQLDQAIEISTPRPPSLEAERKAHMKWVSQVKRALLEDATVSEREAEELANGVATDLNKDPREIAQKLLSDEKE